MSTTPTTLSKLRHLYENMVNGGVRDTASAKRIAEGLLSPAIAELERAALTQGAGSTIEWQVRGRHHYGWRRVSEEIARAMYLVNPGHVRAVTVVAGAVPKAG